jgi:hypothetical protein
LGDSELTNTLKGKSGYSPPLAEVSRSDGGGCISVNSKNKFSFAVIFFDLWLNHEGVECGLNAFMFFYKHLFLR